MKRSRITENNILSKTAQRQPVVSIITVVKNGVKYLEQTILSVIEQTYPNIEYIIVDGGSTDGTLDIIKKYEKYISYWISESDRGLSDAMNKSVSKASGDYIMFLHSDDKYCNSKSVEILMKALNNSTNKWVAGFYQLIDTNDKIIGKFKMRSYSQICMLIRNVINHSATIVPKSIFEKHKFPSNFFYTMDYYYFLNVWDTLGAPYFLKEYITYFRMDGHNLSSSCYRSLKEEYIVKRKYLLPKNRIFMLAFLYSLYFLRLLKIFLFEIKMSINR